MIKDNLKIHDKFSVEIKQSYYSLFKKKKSIYRVITYLFIPNGLNINEQTYTKTQFYKDSRVNIRYNTPEYSSEEILQNENSPLNKWVHSVEKLSPKPTKSQLVELETLGKILATVISSTIRKENRQTRKNFKLNLKKEAIQEFANPIKEILQKYRTASKKLEEYEINYQQKNLLYFADEYISNVVEHQLLMLYNYINDRYTDFDSALKILIDLIKSEQVYKEKKFYKNVDFEHMNHEYIVFKRSQLKKYVDSIFFLNKNIRKDGAIAEQSIFALVAGFAMLFSTGIAFYYQQKYGNFTTAFFIALVLSYMLKDRIKGVIGNLFISKAHHFHFDYKINISNANKSKVGVVKESFQFVKYKKLGPHIKRYRQSDRVVNPEDDLFGEYIIEYKKKISLFPRKLGKELSEEKLNSIVDITRLNLHRYTLNMDNPKKSYYFVKDEEIVRSEEDRVYHINIIQKFYTESGIEFKRYRVVINRNGIKRIEKVDIENL